jgi:aminopeptidase N
MAKSENLVVKLKDYKKLPFRIDQVYLTIDLGLEKTLVRSQMKISDYLVGETIELDGVDLELLKVEIDGQSLSSADYILEKSKLSFKYDKPEFNVTIENVINPQKNTALEGIYRSGSIYCTQCEAEGFRRITYFPDRPDNMTKFFTKVIGDKETEPYLLSNGNLIEKGDLEKGRHYAIWEDPFKKPSYLFAMVAGDLGLVKDNYKTASGRDVSLEIYVDKGNESKTSHAMESLKNSMRWDEKRFGLEYDLDIYMIVAVDSFNMGAMENKGLNIFNSAYVLADKDTATDANFLGIESVIGHEYFHNWSGNRVTCRDWFQLTLKEGLTVYRDQEFSSDLNSRSVKRIEDVSVLRAHQFSEDDGPNAHPIKPKEYEEINNFYTATIYEKGAEVIRMLETLFGKEGFRLGIDKYFELFDGQAVTTEDFLSAMSQANGDYDLSRFKRWYDQKGTPRLNVEFSQRLDEKTAEVKFTYVKPSVYSDSQDWFNPETPIKLCLISEGEVFNLENSNLSVQEKSSGFVLLNDREKVVTFQGVSHEVTPSINRDFSAPVVLETNLSLEQKLFLIRNDDNSFNCYEVAQSLIKEEILGKYRDPDFSLGNELYAALQVVFSSSEMDDATKAMTLSTPSLNVLFQALTDIDVDRLNSARKSVINNIGGALNEHFYHWIKENEQSDDYKLNPEEVGRRSLRSMILSYLSKTDPSSESILKEVYDSSSNMTDRFNSFSSIVSSNFSISNEIQNDFFEKFKKETLVVQKWISTLVQYDDESVFDRLEMIEGLPEFDIKVPNLVRSLVGRFAMGNFGQFHRVDGRGYKYVADKISIVDELNPQIASRLASSFNLYPKLSPTLKIKMKESLESLAKKPNLSKNVAEIVNKILK